MWLWGWWITVDVVNMEVDKVADEVADMEVDMEVDWRGGEDN